MNPKNQPCKICQKIFSSTGSDLCPECIEKYPFFLSFIEEGFIGVTGITFGRIEIYDNRSSGPFDIDELRFVFKDNKQKEARFYKFRDEWDFKNITRKELVGIKTILKSDFQEIIST